VAASATKQPETALAAALTRAGYSKIEMQVYPHLLAFFRAGGTRGQLLSIATRAEAELSGGGRFTPGALSSSAPSRQPSDDAAGQNAIEAQGSHARPSSPLGEVGGHLRSALSAVHPVPPSSPPSRGGAGRQTDVQADHSVSALPVREPTPAQRAAALSVARSIAVTILDTYRIDGIALGEWTVAEALRASKTKTMHGYILRECTRMVANAPSGAKLKTIVKPHEAQRIIQRAAEVSDAA